MVDIRYGKFLEKHSAVGGVTKESVRMIIAGIFFHSIMKISQNDGASHQRIF